MTGSLIGALPTSCVSPVGECNDTSSQDLTVPIVVGALVLLIALALVIVVIVRTARRR